MHQPVTSPTAAQAIVEAAQQVNSEVVVACTRKSVPGTHGLSMKAILSGGAVPHRLGLSETILVFAQHRTFTGRASFSTIIKRLRQRVPEKKIVVEADTLAEAVAITDAGADVVQLDKASPVDVATLRRHCETCTPRPLVAAAGGSMPCARLQPRQFPAQAGDAGADQGLVADKSGGRYVTFQMAEVAIARQMFQEILRLIAELRSQPPPALARDVRCHAFQSNRQKECVQMPGEMAKPDPRPSARVTRGACSSQHLASLWQEGRETRTLMPVWDSSGESRSK